METTIKKKVKGIIIENLFYNSGNDLFNIRYLSNLDIKSDEEYLENKVYNYEIRIRHAENTNAKILLNKAIEKATNLTNNYKN